MDDILAAWSGGQPATPATVAPEPQPEVEASPAPSEPEPEQQAAASVAVIEPVFEEAPLVAAPQEEKEIDLEPVPIGVRLRTALRIGAWTGAALGVVGFLAGAAFWAPDATLIPDTGPAIQVNPTSLMIGVALISVVFGAIVAGVSRAATSWSNPSMELSSSRSSTAWIGGLIGLVLGLVAAAVMASFGTEVEGAEPAITQLPVLPTFAVMVIGGALLGAATALIPQALGVPVAVAEDDREEVDVVRTRLGNAMSIPLAGLLLLVVLVLPFAYALIESNHLAPGSGGAIVAIVAASGILGFAALAGSRPEMRISFGDLIWAILGIGVVLLIIIAALLARDSGEGHSEPEEARVVVQLL